MDIVTYVSAITGVALAGGFGLGVFSYAAYLDILKSNKRLKRRDDLLEKIAKKLGVE